MGTPEDPNCEQCQNCYTCQKDVAICQTCENCVTCQQDVSGAVYCQTCQNCVTCQDGVGGGPIRGGVCDTNKSDYQARNYFVFLTHDCNLRCTYCFVPKGAKKMTDEVLEATVQFIFKDTRNPSIQFFGGEPTYEWVMLQKFVNRAKDVAKQLGRQAPKFGMTTNGTLLTEERLLWLKEQGMQPLLSVDGRKATHDRNRKFRGNKGKASSWERIPLKRIAELWPAIEIRPSIMPETAGEFDLDVRFLMDEMGFTNVATEVVYEQAWSENQLAAARGMFGRLADLYIERKGKGRPCFLKFIEDVRKGLRGGGQAAKGTVCGTGRNSIGITAEGKLYPCQRWAGYQEKAADFCYGDVWGGADEIRLARIQSMMREHMKPEEGFDCSTCPARYHCMGGCNAMNWEVTGARERIAALHCRFLRMQAPIALEALARTGELFEVMRPAQAAGQHHQHQHGCQHQRPDRLAEVIEQLNAKLDSLGEITVVKEQ